MKRYGRSFYWKVTGQGLSQWDSKKLKHKGDLQAWIAMFPQIREIIGKMLLSMMAVFFPVIFFLTFSIFLFSAVLKIEVEVSTGDKKYPGCDNLDFIYFEHCNHARLDGGRGDSSEFMRVNSKSVIIYMNLTKLSNCSKWNEIFPVLFGLSAYTERSVITTKRRSHFDRRTEKMYLGQPGIFRLKTLR